jgi:CubicO group peptidase (beta-lactamase class C family)
MVMYRVAARIALVLTIIALASSVPLARADDRPVVNGDVGRRLDEYLSRLERFGFSGGALAVRGKDVLLMKSYGLSDRAKNIPLATDSVYNLGSITKQFTAAGILTLEMQGKLSVNDLASKYLDGVPADKASITLHHLLTHSSGLESDFSPTDYDPVGREEYVRRALQSTLLFKPGSGYEYSNAGYSLLAAIVEKVSGRPYEAYLIEQVLEPAGMIETGYKAPAWAASRIAHGYRDGQDWGTIVQRIEPPDAPYWMLRGNGGLHTTLGDVLKWHRALDGDAVLSKDARAKYFKPYVAEGPAQRSFYAYGWAISKTPRGTTVVQHNGGNGVYVAEFMRFPDEDAMIFLTSTNAEMKASQVVPILERILFGGTASLPPAVVNIAPETLARLAGRWVLPKGGVITMTVDGNALAARADDPEALSALAPPPPGQAERFAQLTARTDDLSARAFRGDVRGLHEAMGGDMPLDQVKTQEAGMMRDREGRLGRFLKSSALATVPREGDTVQTIVRLDFEKASVFNIYIWGPRRILGIRGMPELPALRFLPVSDRAFASYSIEMGGAGQTLSFETAGGETVLVLRTPAGPVTAHRGDHKGK